MGELVFRLGFGDEIVDAGLFCDGLRGQRVVAGDHDGADAHLAQVGEAFAQAFVDVILELDDAQHLDFAGGQLFGHDQRGAALRGDGVDTVVQSVAHFDAHDAPGIMSK